MNDFVTKEEALLAEQMAAEGLKVQLENRAFARLSKAQQRVTIAKDVLKWMAAGKLTARRGTYLDLLGEAAEMESAPSIVNGYSCQACALGAVFAVAAEKGCFTITEVDNWNNRDEVVYADVMQKRLAPYFDEQQLYLIENAFEGAKINEVDDKGLDNRAQAFCRGTRSASQRMEAIMKNIIQHRGTFKP